MLYKLVRKSASIGLLCNHSAWRTTAGKYTFQLLAETGKLSKLFVPEHGLFGELQDQVKLDDTAIYKTIAGRATVISLYSNNEHSLTANDEQLSGIDTLVVDIQDAGCRYYTYITTLYLLLQKISNLKLSITILVIDKPNPAGRQVEGTRMSAHFSSFIGLQGLPHRHGLTLAELCRYFKSKLNATWELIIVPVDEKKHVFISPSPNIPTINTCKLYSGQCLWEGTNVSEGRGTTLPFETTGAPFMSWVFDESWNSKKHPAYNSSCSIRPIRFIPTFHKYAGEVCNGIQLMLLKKNSYHSLAHSLQLIRYCRERSAAFAWREGKYEALNDGRAIDLLVGDVTLLDYLHGKDNWKEVATKMADEETAWIKEVNPFLIYKSRLTQLKLNK